MGAPGWLIWSEVLSDSVNERRNGERNAATARTAIRVMRNERFGGIPGRRRGLRRSVWATVISWRWALWAPLMPAYFTSPA